MLRSLSCDVHARVHSSPLCHLCLFLSHHRATEISSNWRASASSLASLLPSIIAAACHHRLAIALPSVLVSFEPYIISSDHSYRSPLVTFTLAASASHSRQHPSPLLHQHCLHLSNRLAVTHFLPSDSVFACRFSSPRCHRWPRFDFLHSATASTRH